MSDILATVKRTKARITEGYGCTDADALALVAEVERLRERVREDNAVCLCGCPDDAHELDRDDGESCEDESHTCVRVPRAVAEEFAALRGRLEKAMDKGTSSPPFVAVPLSERR